jgi:hypothetical protein
LKKRIFGTECEYATVLKESAGDIPTPSSAALTGEALVSYKRQISETILSSIRAEPLAHAGEFLANGGRLYVDQGGHPEYATPECLTVEDVLTHEIAGDRLMQQSAERVRSRANLHVYKNNVDFFGHTYGSHENYLVSARGMEQIETLIPFWVTRQIYAGAGKLARPTPGGPLGFQISQRADFFNRTYSDRTSEVRGIINTRKREIHRHGGHHRFHLILGDSNLSQSAIGLKIGITALLLRMIEEGAENEVLTLTSPVAALKAISRSMTCRVPVMRGGRRGQLSPLEIQSLFLEKALGFYETHGANRREREQLEKWERILEGLKELAVSQSELAILSDGKDVRRKIDWVLKLWLLGRCREKKADDRQLKTVDIQYHDLDPRTGLYLRCLALDQTDRLITEEKILQAMAHPPRNTRASLRGWIIDQALKAGLQVQVENWQDLFVETGKKGAGTAHFFNQIRHRANRMEIHLTDPFKYKDSKIIEGIETFIQKFAPLPVTPPN